MFKKIISLIIFLFSIQVFLFSISGCKITKESKSIKESSDTFYIDIKAKPAHRLIKENINSSDFVIIDVRRPDEYLEGYIDNSLKINFKDESFSSQLNQLDKNKTYLVYCQGGYLSKKAMLLMKKIGFKKVYNLKGGYLVWKSKKLPLVK